MNIKKFKDYKIIKESVFDDEQDIDSIENKWEVRIDDATDSFWEYKADAIAQVLEILDTQGDKNGLEGYTVKEYEDEEDYEVSINELVDNMTMMDEDEFYSQLEELKDFVVYDKDIKIINIADEDELEFLE